MRYLTLLLLTILLLLTSSCQPVCSPDSVTYVSNPAVFPSANSLINGNLTPTPSFVEIRGRMVEVDRVIHGPICNDVWSGTIYVGCDVQVVEWKDEGYPTFFKYCDLTIEPDTTVYVAAHNNTAYYKGCSCHVQGETK